MSIWHTASEICFANYRRLACHILIQVFTFSKLDSLSEPGLTGGDMVTKKGCHLEVTALNSLQYYDEGLLFNYFNHLERNPDDGFIIFTGFKHIFIILLVIPVNDYLAFAFMNGFQLLEYIKDTF